MDNSLNLVLRPALPDLGNDGLGRIVWIHKVYKIAHLIFHTLVPKVVYGRATLWVNAGRSDTSGIAVERTSRYGRHCCRCQGLPEMLGEHSVNSSDPTRGDLTWITSTRP
jgi:hypothetical protein